MEVITEQPLPREVRGEIDEYEREKQRLEKAKKAHAVLRNDNTRRSARLHRIKNKFYSSSLID